MNTSDSGDNPYIKNTWLLGGTMSCIIGKYINFIMEELLYSDTLSRWNSIILSNGKKSILIITAY